MLFWLVIVHAVTQECIADGDGEEGGEDTALPFLRLHGAFHPHPVHP